MELRSRPLPCIILRIRDYLYYIPNLPPYMTIFTSAMVDISPFEALLPIIDPSGAEPYIFVDSCFSSSDKKPRSG